MGCDGKAVAATEGCNRSEIFFSYERGGNGKGFWNGKRNHQMVVVLSACTSARAINGKERRMNDTRMKDILEKIAQQSVPESTNLWPRIAAQLDERKSLMNIVRTRPLVAILVTLLILLTLQRCGLCTWHNPGLFPWALGWWKIRATCGCLQSLLKKHAMV